MRLSLSLSFLLLFATLASVFVFALGIEHAARCDPGTMHLTQGLVDARRWACLVSAAVLAISLWRLRRKEDAIHAVIANVVGSVWNVMCLAAAMFSQCVSMILK